MVKINMDMIQTIGLAVILLLIGMKLRKKIKFFEKYCIPAPVIGGFLFSIFVFILRQTNVAEIKFTDTLQKFFMVMFFTSVGFNASLKVLKKGGKKVLIFLFVAAGLCILQNAVAVGLSKFVGLPPLLALMTGSTPMTGGHGTSAVFAVPLENLGLSAANTITLAAATFGLVAGSLTGGPLGRYLVEKSIKNNKVNYSQKANIDINEETENKLSAKGFEQAIFLLLLAMALGTMISVLLGKTGLTFPASVGGMLASAFIVNIKNFDKLYPIKHSEIHIFGEVSLAIFLSMSMMKLKLWQIIDLAGPMLILLFAQVILIIIFIIFIAFPVMGKDYEAAVTCSGFCGYGLGAVPTGIANMDTLTEKYYPAPESFFIVPLVGSLFINIVNTFMITFFMNIV